MMCSRSGSELSAGKSACEECHFGVVTNQCFVGVSLPGKNQMGKLERHNNYSL